MSVLLYILLDTMCVILFEEVEEDSRIINQRDLMLYL